jgi:hypothetical protein
LGEEQCLMDFFSPNKNEEHCENVTVQFLHTLASSLHIQLPLSTGIPNQRFQCPPASLWEVGPLAWAPRVPGRPEPNAESSQPEVMAGLGQRVQNYN